MNKCDVAQPDLDEIAGIARRKLRQRPPVLPVSAKTPRRARTFSTWSPTCTSRYTAHIATGG